MRVLVCGDRNWWQRDYLFNVLDNIQGISCIINGLARGADTMGREWAIKNDINYEDYPALWDKYGRAAGPIRNKQMLDEGKPDFVAAFHENIDLSKGTKNMVNQAQNRKIQFKIYTGL